LVSRGVNWADRPHGLVQGGLGPAGKKCDDPQGTKREREETGEIPIKENLHLMVRAEFFNVLNTVNFRAPTTDLQDRSFGKITSAAAGRTGQISLTLFW
jgi:hypothetical protein